MKIQKITTIEEHEKALNELSTLMHNNLTKEDDSRFDYLVKIIELYEDEAYRETDKIDPIDALKFRMKMMGLTQKDLIPYIGSASKVSEVLNRKRPLSLTMIQKLNKGLHIPADLLINQDRNSIKENNKSVIYANTSTKKAISVFRDSGRRKYKKSKK